MKRTAKLVVVIAALALQALARPALAASSTMPAFGSYSNAQIPGKTASVNLNFSLVIPKFLCLQVGSTGGTVNTISFSPSAAQVGTGVNISGTGGDLGGGAVTVLAQGNTGTGLGTLVYSTTNAAGTPLAALTDGTRTIAWSTIKVASTGSASIAHPATLTDASGSPVTISAALPTVFNVSATWTYSWNDGGVVNPASTYTGRVAYSLSQP
jgi:hypothetical protein